VFETYNLIIQRGVQTPILIQTAFNLLDLEPVKLSSKIAENNSRDKCYTIDGNIPEQTLSNAFRIEIL
jgi:hypothetical protein